MSTFKFRKDTQKKAIVYTDAIAFESIKTVID